MAMAADSLPQAAMVKLSDAQTIMQTLESSDNGLVRVVVDVTMPSVPEISTFANEDEADAARISASHRAQNSVLGRVFAVEGGLQEVKGSSELAEQLGLQQLDFLSRFAITVDSEMLARLAADPDVIRIEPERQAELFLNQGTPTSLERIQMPAAWAAGATGQGWHVAVLDTGGRRTHKFLNQRIVSAACYSAHAPGSGSYSLCPGAVSESINIDSANDCDNTTIAGCGHGTHVAGTAAGFNSNPATGEPLYGAAPNARIISINVFSRRDPANCGSNFLSNGCVRANFTDIEKGLERVYALRNTYNIASLNMSLGGGLFPSTCDNERPSTTTLVNMLASAGIATVVAAGNDGSNTQVSWPACISSAVAVANSTKADGIAGSSNWGPEIDVVAPGSSIYASDVSGPTGNTWSYKTGTSMAAPHVAGVYAALKSARPNATLAQILTALQNTGTILNPSWGVAKPRINVNSALTSLPGAAAKAVMTSPAPGSTISSSSATFSWTTGTGVSSYFLTVGNTGVASSNIFNSAVAGTSRLVTGLPATGTLNVRLWSYINSAWQYNDYTYTMNAGTKAVMSSPTPGSTITNSSATFSWTAGSGVSSYWLYVGTNGAGSANIFTQGGAQRTRTVTGLPSSGTLYVRLMSYIGSGWQFNDYTYTMNAGTKAVMSSPTPGSTLTNTSATFNWTAGSGVASYWLMVGNNGAGSANILSQGGAQTSRTVTGLPSSGTLNVRLMSYIGSAWQFNDYTYTMSAGAKAVMTTPAPGSTLQNTTMMFQWTAGSGVSSYWLYVGTNGAGSANIFSSGVTNPWRAVGGLPRVGTVNVRLMSYIGGGWQFNDYTYTMAVPASITTPAPGSTLPGAGVMFQWDAHASISNYWLYVGTGGAGSGNILSTGVTNTWRYVGGLPASGQVNVRLMSWMGGVWRFRDYTYTGSAGGWALEAVGEDEFSSLIRSISLE
ncbi:MAG: S8 family serine peptidase [Mesorhizobium sp.]|nr:S8 family serine peptidase [Mesorhizobium sp.]